MMGAEQQLGGDHWPSSHPHADRRGSNSPMLSFTHKANPFLPGFQFGQTLFNLAALLFASVVVGLTFAEIGVLLLIVFVIGV